MDIHTILVAVDFSAHSAKALDAAMDLARRYGAKLELVHAYPIDTAVYPYGMIIGEEMERKIRETAQGQLDAWCEKAAKAGLPAAASVVPRAPIEAILELAEELPADLIVMGTRGLSGLKHVMLGSVAERTVRLAPCPVLTVRA